MFVAVLAAAVVISPCRLVTGADAQAALGLTVAPPRLETIGFFRQCTYKHGNSFVAVQTRAISKANFVLSAESNARPIGKVNGLGVPAYTSAGIILLIWKNGTEATFLVFNPKKTLKDTEALAKRVLSRLP